MELSLKVMSGKNAGLLIKVPHERFLIGRSEECQLRPHSDLISRQHTEILIAGDAVSVKDMGSRNGTFVNGERIPGSVPLKHGDKLGVGQLVFEVLLPSTVKKAAPIAAPVPKETVANSAPKVGTAASNNVMNAPPKQPKVKDVADVARRVSKSTSNIDDDDISDWLSGDDVEALNETSTIQLSQTQQWELQQAAEAELGATSDSAVIDGKNDPKAKKVYGKLPPVPKQGIDAKNSRDAAADLIKQMMKKR